MSLQLRRDRGTWLTGAGMVLAVALGWALLVLPGAAGQVPSEPPTGGRAWSGGDAVAAVGAHLPGRGFAGNNERAVADEVVLTVAGVGLLLAVALLGTVAFREVLVVSALAVVVGMASQWLVMLQNAILMLRISAERSTPFFLANRGGLVPL